MNQFTEYDTLVRLDRNRLPAVQIGGREVRSSVPQLHPIAAPVLHGVGLETFYDAFLWSYQEADRFRAESHEEIPAHIAQQVMTRSAPMNISAASMICSRVRPLSLRMSSHAVASSDTISSS